MRLFTETGKFEEFSYGHGTSIELANFGWNYTPKGQNYIKPPGLKTPAEWAKIDPDDPKPN